MAHDFSRLIITGANGWIGRAALACAARWWGPTALERVQAFGSTDAELHIQGCRFSILALNKLTPDIVDGAIVMHLAALTKDRLSNHSVTDFLDFNAAIDSVVLSAIQRATPRGLFVASSGAAKLVEEGGGDFYGLAKLIQERRFGELLGKLEGKVLRGRIWSIAGPHMNKPEAYALGDFLKQGWRTGRIHIKATQPVYRSYLHVDDIIDLSISALLDARAPNTVIDLAGMEVVEMQDVAASAALALGLETSCISRPPLILDQRNIYVGDWAPFRELALASSATPQTFSQQVADTLAYFEKLWGF
jgi:nucleoside-diphosphate-sugar epimerase